MCLKSESIIAENSILLSSLSGPGKIQVIKKAGDPSLKRRAALGNMAGTVHYIWALTRAAGPRGRRPLPSLNLSSHPCLSSFVPAASLADGSLLRSWSPVDFRTSRTGTASLGLPCLFVPSSVSSLLGCSLLRSALVLSLSRGTFRLSCVCWRRFRQIHTGPVSRHWLCVASATCVFGFRVCFLFFREPTELHCSQ